MVQILIRPALAPSMETIAFQAIIRLVAGAQSPRRARLLGAHSIPGIANSLLPTRLVSRPERQASEHSDDFTGGYRSLRIRFD